MNDIITQFIDAMSNYGIYPSNASDIKPDNKRHDFHLSGDPKAKKKGFYKLKIDGDFGVGFFGDWRTGECHSWHSKAPKRYTEQERAAFAEKLRIQREQDEAEQLAAWKAKATEAQDFMLFLSDCTEHPYLSKKGVKPYALFISGQDLIIPMRDELGDVVNYQRIRPDGEKRFLAEARKQGTWFEISGDDTICLVEGYATGASVHEATGHTVIVAFDAGNLVAIAPHIKKKYQNKTIIICADNDHETKDRRTGESKNTGILKAIEASRLLDDCKIIYPEFTEKDCGLSDFNDLHIKYGLDAVANRISGAKPEPDGVGSVLPSESDLQPPDPIDLIQSNAWRDQLIKNKKGDLEPRSMVNFMLIMENCDHLKGVFKHDSFSKRIIVRRPPPWEDSNKFVVRPVQDYDYIRLETFLEGFFGLKTSREKCANAIESVALNPENTFNPASEYFSSLKWDGVDRINSWIYNYVSTGEQDTAYLSLVGRKFLCGLAGRAMNAGCKFDTMLILEGKQYAGKSFLSKILGTINGVEYFLDDFKDIENKDALMKMQGKLVVEFPEISTMRKAEVNDLKAFLSRTHDVFRPPYGRNTMESGRQCVFIGTVNPEGPYLRDVTGNRRYWPVACRDKIDIPHLKEIMPQLHAQAAYLVKNGEKLWLTEDEYNLCVIEQDKRVMNDIWSDKIIDAVGGQTQVTTSDILSALGVSLDKANPIIQSRISQTMIQLGYTSARISVGGKRRRGYIKNGHQPSLALQKEDEGEEIAW